MSGSPANPGCVSPLMMTGSVIKCSEAVGWMAQTPLPALQPGSLAAGMLKSMVSVKGKLAFACSMAARRLHWSPTVPRSTSHFRSPVSASTESVVSLTVKVIGADRAVMAGSARTVSSARAAAASRMSVKRRPAGRESAEICSRVMILSPRGNDSGPTV